MIHLQKIPLLLKIIHLQKIPSPAKEVFKTLFDKIEPINPKELEDGEFEFNHIFIGNAKIYNSERVFPSIGTTYWIGKMESVDGFFLGNI